MKNRLRGINRLHKTNYQIQKFEINAAHYGVPQLRERIFLIGTRNGYQFELPTPTHYLSLEEKEAYPHSLAATTTWDAIGHLQNRSSRDCLKLSGRWADLLPSIPEGCNYLWHTDRNDGKPLFGWRTRYWSFLLKLAKDHPSWTLQANPGPATGPFHWKNRRLSREELLSLQTFPTGYDIFGEYRDAVRQIGNAVPSALGELFGLEIRRQLLGHRVRRKLRLIPTLRKNCPPRERLRPVKKKYLELIGEHAPHPGNGLGPRSQNQMKNSR